MYSDDDAPECNAAPGSRIALLDACLVDGYGNQTAAGWEKTAVSSNIALYRAPTGLRHYLWVDDSGTTTASVNAYRDWVSGVGSGNFSTASQFWAKSNTAIPAGRQWVLAADDKSFLLFVSPLENVNTNFKVMGFGELAKHHAADLNASFLLAANTANNALLAENVDPTHVDGGIYVSGEAAAYMPGYKDGSLGPAKYGATINGPRLGSYYNVDCFDAEVDWVWTSRILMRNSYSIGVTQYHDNTLCLPRGYIPGLLAPMNEMTPQVFPFWTSLGEGKVVIPHSLRRAYVLDTGDWDYQ
jgi:hypothetical protein